MLLARSTLVVLAGAYVAAPADPLRVMRAAPPGGGRGVVGVEAGPAAQGPMILCFTKYLTVARFHP